MLRLTSLFIFMSVIAASSFGQGLAAVTQSPVAVSPGSPTGVVISDPCPTFSWGAERGARSYEIVVYRLDKVDEAGEPDLVLDVTVVGSASSWTPSMDRCLERSGQYAWSVRALGQEVSDWSRPSLFDLAAGPTRAEFEEALRLVQRYLVAQTEAADLGEEPRVEESGAEQRTVRSERPSLTKGTPLPMLFNISGGARVAGDLDLGGSLISTGEICIGACP